MQFIGAATLAEGNCVHGPGREARCAVSFLPEPLPRRPFKMRELRGGVPDRGPGRRWVRENGSGVRPHRPSQRISTCRARPRKGYIQEEEARFAFITIRLENAQLGALKCSGVSRQLVSSAVRAMTLPGELSPAEPMASYRIAVAWRSAVPILVMCPSLGLSAGEPCGASNATAPLGLLSPAGHRALARSAPSRF